MVRRRAPPRNTAKPFPWSVLNGLRKEAASADISGIPSRKIFDNRQGRGYNIDKGNACC
jgi:hypothetical protein